VSTTLAKLKSETALMLRLRFCLAARDVATYARNRSCVMLLRRKRDVIGFPRREDVQRLACPDKKPSAISREGRPSVGNGGRAQSANGHQEEAPKIQHDVIAKRTILRREMPRMQ
jgi:hypothetical protein